MGLFNFLFPPRPSSALIAKERLQIVLSHERASRDAPDFLPILQKELLDVVGRYVDIRDDMIRVNLGKTGDTRMLEINIELNGATPRAEPKPATAGATAKPAANRSATKPAASKAAGGAPSAKPN